MARHFLLLVLFFVTFAANAQNAKSLIKKLHEHNFEKVKSKLDKTLEKDSFNVVALYISSLYYADTANQTHYQSESAYTYALAAIESFRNIDPKEQEKLEKDGLTHQVLTQHKEKLEQLAFHHADSVHSLAAYQLFIDLYPTAIQFDQAITQRDSLAYSQAKQEDSYESYRKFLDAYPQAAQAEKAQARYDLLLYRAKTNPVSIAKLEKFIQSYPNNPYRQEAEKKLYFLFVDQHQLHRYQEFVKRYPENIYAERAWKWLWFLSPDKISFQYQYPDFPDKDFLNRHLTLQHTKLFPFVKEGKIGFIDSQGKEQIEPYLSGIQEDHLCEYVDQDFIITEKLTLFGAVDKAGRKIADCLYQHVEFFAPGALKIQQKEGIGLYHKAGFSLIEPHYQALEPAGSYLVKAKQNDKWGLVSYYDSLVLPFQYDRIEVLNDQVAALYKAGKIAIAPIHDLLQRKVKDPVFGLDGYELTHENFLQVQKGDQYGIQSVEGRTIVPTEALAVEEITAGWLVHYQAGQVLYNKKGLLISPLHYKDVLPSEKVFGVKPEDKWGVIDQKGQMIIQPLYDTLYFIGDDGILLERDHKKFGYFYQENLTDLSKYSKLTVQVSTFHYENKTDTVPFIIARDKSRKEGLLTGKGNVLIQNKYNEMSFITDSTLLVDQWGKKGLVSLRGKTMIAPRYQGVMPYEEHFYAIFQNKKFGLYNARFNQLINPGYDALLKRYNSSDTLLIAKKGNFGLINLANETITPFQFDAIHYWSDSVMLVQQQAKWKLYNFQRNYFLPETFDSFEYLRNDAHEVVILTYRSTGYGVLSNRYGRIIQEEYSDILNLGTPEEPVYFVEKSVSQAGLFIVLYINQEGKIIKEQVLKEEDYEKIVCLD
ncbi:WG repeat-containing protein [Rapidithrix thailandica]|uniref:WG repeat-containing protein n=1 Tax=Rapidithrix thailandica TaxID=413964 RepID=A0AAW9S6T5_9BACT